MSKPLKASVSATFVFADVPIEFAVVRAKQAGFAALEFQVIDPASATHHAPLITAAGLRTALVNLDVGDFISGGPGLSAVPDRADLFRDALAAGVIVAQHLRPDVVHIGPSRMLPGASRVQCLQRLADNICHARDALSPLGCRISIEVLNSVEFPGLAVESVERALALIDRIGGDNIVLQYDIYHAAMDDRDVLADIAALGSRIGHVQFADCPGRGEPGTGRVDLGVCFEALRTIGYTGYVGAEYRPTAADDFAWLSLI